MAKYKAYPDYKDSGVEWFDVKPSSWKVTRLKLETLISMGQSPSSDDCNIEGDGWAFLQGNAEFGKVNPIEKQYCPVAKKIANPGDILFSVRAPVGAINLADKNYGIGRGLCSIAASENVTSPFLWWLLPTYKYQLDAIATGSTFEAVSAEQLGNLCFALPSFSEQSQIVAFLDHETAKIDNLIEKQQQLIELLKEKRQAVISHAVTKGLNPDVPMKDSGVEWLGDIPKHWIPARLKYHTRQIVDGAHFTPTYTEKGIPFLRVTDIQDKYIDFDNIKFIPEHEHKELIKRCRPENGDLLLSKNGTIGVPKLVDWDWEFSIFVSLCLLKFKSTLTPEYSEFYFKSHEIKEQIFGLIKQSTVINLHLDKIQNFWFCIPPLEEQYKIVNYLNEKIDTLECLIENAELTIRLAQERRTALISAAVTGKIDVRDWVAPDTQDIEELQETAV